MIGNGWGISSLRVGVHEMLSKPVSPSTILIAQITPPPGAKWPHPARWGAGVSLEMSLLAEPDAGPLGLLVVWLRHPSVVDDPAQAFAVTPPVQLCPGIFRIEAPDKIEAAPAFYFWNDKIDQDGPPEGVTWEAS